MKCVLEFNGSSSTKYELFCRGNKQRILIDILLNYAQLELADIASIVGVSMNEVQGIYQDKFLKEQSATNLLYLFLIFIAD